MAFSFDFKALQGGFFDAKKILDDVEKAEAKAMSKFGAFTRQRMKTSIKYRDKVAAAGQPPSAHRSRGFSKAKVNKKTGVVSRQQQSPLRELIFFALDPATKSVVIGPVAFGQNVAGIVERGGTGMVTDPRTGLRKSAHFSPHPFAEPAGRAEAAKFPELLRNMVR